MSHTISATDRTDTVYGQVWVQGGTEAAGPMPGLRAQLGFGPDGSDPASDSAWEWVEATFNTQSGSNDEFSASLQPETVGEFDYAYRYSTTDGRDWVYADLDGSANGYSASEAGALSVNPSSDTTAPAAPADLAVSSASPAGIALEWSPVADAVLYEIQRSDTAGGPFARIARTDSATFTDSTVAEAATYRYVVVAIDHSFNRSVPSDAVEATAELRTVTLTFNVTVPVTTDEAIATTAADKVNIAGFLDRLDGGHPQWNPGGTPLTQVSPTAWTITLTGREGTQLEYKYALGSWDFVEKDGSCAEIGNRQLTLTYGTDGQQVVNDTVANWRNVAPCGN